MARGVQPVAPSEHGRALPRSMGLRLLVVSAHTVERVRRLLRRRYRFSQWVTSPPRGCCEPLVLLRRCLPLQQVAVRRAGQTNGTGSETRGSGLR